MVSLLAAVCTAGCVLELLYLILKPVGAAKVNVLPPVASCFTKIVTVRAVPAGSSSVSGSVTVVSPVSV